MHHPHCFSAFLLAKQNNLSHAEWQSNVFVTAPLLKIYIILKHQERSSSAKVKNVNFGVLMLHSVHWSQQETSQPGSTDGDVNTGWFWTACLRERKSHKRVKFPFILIARKKVVKAVVMLSLYWYHMHKVRLNVSKCIPPQCWLKKTLWKGEQ